MEPDLVNNTFYARVALRPTYQTTMDCSVLATTESLTFVKSQRYLGLSLSSRAGTFQL